MRPWYRSKWPIFCADWNPEVAAKRPAAGPDAPAPRAAAPGGGHRARSLARRLALQALYQLQINPRPWPDVRRQFAADPEAARVDLEYFDELTGSIAAHRAALDAQMSAWCQIAPADLDPIEHALLWLGVHELASRPQVPFRVVLAEAVQLARQFGATDGHKFVNAVLDRAARELRPDEYGRTAE
jgi:transcription antitermination protein NusB